MCSGIWSQSDAAGMEHWKQKMARSVCSEGGDTRLQRVLHALLETWSLSYKSEGPIFSFFFNVFEFVNKTFKPKQKT